jgi:hypothetical protein
MKSSHVLDYRDEFYLKTFRRWYVVKLLCDNKKFIEGVPLQKAGLVDFLINNPPVLNKFLVHFGKAVPSLSLDDLLYKDDLEYGGGQDLTDFSRTCVLLISKEKMEMKRIDGEICLLNKRADFEIESALSDRWQTEVKLIQPLLNKSMAVLSTGILRGGNGN